MGDLRVRQLRESDLADADRINRLAFGTFFGLEDPMKFRGDGDVVRGRYAANPAGAFAAERDGRLIGCGFVMDWGSVGILGPVTVDVAHWGRGVARALMADMVAYMDRRGFALQGLFTHPQSPSHIRLYESFGFGMQAITGVMDRQVDPQAGLPEEGRLLSTLALAERERALAGCRDVADAVFPGLDLSGEILSIAACGFGDTLLIEAGGTVRGFACCHQGAMSEAGSAQVLVKFAAVLPGAAAADDFARLLAGAEGFAAGRGVRRLVAGTNTGRAGCYRAMQSAGFRTWMNGVAMMRPSGPGYNRAGVFAIDDWR
mgnify:CR=1 FL=1